MIARARWWLVFLLDVAACLVTALVAGATFGAHAFVEDVRFAYRRPRP
jgi:hypothetical protein